MYNITLTTSHYFNTLISDKELSTFLLIFIIYTFSYHRWKKKNKIFVIFTCLIFFFVIWLPTLPNNFQFYNNFIFNNKLTNGFVNIHPLLLYLSYCYIVFCINVKKIKQQYFIKKILFIAILTMLFGSWWAEQEIAWNFWWSWDFIEIFLFSVICILLQKLHFNQTNLKNNYNSTYIELFFILILFTLSTRFSLINSLHQTQNFNFWVENLYNIVYLGSLNFIVYFFIKKKKLFCFFHSLTHINNLRFAFFFCSHNLLTFPCIYIYIKTLSIFINKNLTIYFNVIYFNFIYTLAMYVTLVLYSILLRYLTYNKLKYSYTVMIFNLFSFINIFLIYLYKLNFKNNIIKLHLVIILIFFFLLIYKDICLNKLKNILFEYTLNNNIILSNLTIITDNFSLLTIQVNSCYIFEETPFSFFNLLTNIEKKISIIFVQNYQQWFYLNCNFFNIFVDIYIFFLIYFLLQIWWVLIKKKSTHFGFF